MRVAYLPVISARNVQAAPSYNFVRAFREHLLRLDPNAVLYVLVPRLGDDTRWKEGADWTGPRTHVIPVDMTEMQFDDLALVTRDVFDRFNERFGDLYFDVLITERPQTVAMLRKLVQHPIVSKSRRPLIVCRDQLSLGTDWFKIDPVEELLQAAGWSEAPTIFQSPHQAKRAVNIARKHVQPHHVRRMTEQMQVFPLGIDCDDVDQINAAERDQKYDEIRVNYSHKLFIEQKFLESLKIMDSVFAGGRPVKLQIVTGSSAAKMSMLPRARQYKYMETYGSMGRTAFLKQMARAHVFISNSYWEDFSATVVEQIWTGLIPVLARHDWSEYLVPDGYPYLFRSMEEGQAMLRYVVDNYDEVLEEWGGPLRRKVRMEFDLQDIVPQMVRWIRELHWARPLKSASRDLIQVVSDAYAVLPDEFDLPMFYEAIKKVADHLDVTKQGTESRATSPWLCVDLLHRQHPDLVDLGGEQASYRKGGSDGTGA
jgi:hypothetical protein